MTTAVAAIELTAMTSAAPKAAWAALTDPAIVADWFAEATQPGPVGSPYRIDFGDGSVIDGTVREHEPGRRLAYTWSWAGAEPRTETLVTWTVEADPAGGSRITLIHSGWAEAGADAATREDHLTYWEMYLDDLVRLLDADVGGSEEPGDAG